VEALPPRVRTRCHAGHQARSAALGALSSAHHFILTLVYAEQRFQAWSHITGHAFFRCGMNISSTPKCPGKHNAHSAMAASGMTPYAKQRLHKIGAILVDASNAAHDEGDISGPSKPSRPLT
jgi:hypothetical protein